MQIIKNRISISSHEIGCRHLMRLCDHRACATRALVLPPS
jgi:hypothetical protein